MVKEGFECQVVFELNFYKILLGILYRIIFKVGRFFIKNGNYFDIQINIVVIKYSGYMIVLIGGKVLEYYLVDSYCILGLLFYLFDYGYVNFRRQLQGMFREVLSVNSREF